MKTLEILTNLFQRGEIYISISPPFRIEFEIHQDIKAKAIREADIKVKDFRNELAEIQAMLLSILRHDEDAFISSEVEDLKDEDAIKIKSDNIKKQFENIKQFQKIVDPKNEIERRYKWKASSRVPTYTTADWDIKKKVADSKGWGDFKFPYATLRIKFQREFGDDPFLMFGGRMFDAVQLNFSKEEAEHFAGVALNMVKELKSAEEIISKPNLEIDEGAKS